MPVFKDGNERSEKEWELLMGCLRKEPCSTCDRVVNRKAVEKKSRKIQEKDSIDE